MVNIIELPNELSLKILSYFEYDKATLCQLALVSSHFRPLAKEALLKHLVLSANLLEDEHNSSFDRILQILVEEPNIATLVRTLTLSWTHQENYPRAEYLLQRLPLLESLYLSVPFFASSEDGKPHRPSFRFLQKHPFNRLTKLQLASDITWLDLTEFMYLPKLEHLNLHHLPPCDAVPLPEKFQGRISPVRSIDLQHCRSALDRSLERLLQRAGKLEVLQLRCGVHYWPLRFGQSLAPAHHTLRSLTITGRGMYIGMDDSRLDLSGFQMLQKVDVFSFLFFSSFRANKARDGLYRLLPQSLLELRIEFPPNTGLIESTPQTVTHVFKGWELDWVMEIALNKATHFPGFSSLSLLERLHVGAQQCEEFILPEPLKLAFEVSSIAFQGWCREGWWRACN
ncbi:hypothetical protein EG329_007731 [Mollisiaceae sp. DMI_Dod_QoI]|nr:hypothetical protein EG329_007731 [Helotiales sp. DMI_Dod_QoI]